MPPDTIAAIATASGPAGIGIVRLSGPAALAIGGRVLRRDLRRQTSRALRRAAAFDPETGEAIDDGLAAVFRAPRSFTGEDVVEFQGHGAPVALTRILSALLAAGARLARPGEFTERAFLNGKMDLSRAEAVADFIAAATTDAQRAARRLLEGDLSRAVASVCDLLRDALARIEASIDFPEEVGEINPEEVEGLLASSIHRAADLLATARHGRALTEGITLVLAGYPNVGKSSLLNALAGAERAIVTPVPGTTRDIVSETVVVAGLPVRALDTAGLRETADPVEAIGVARAKEAAARADVLVLVCDATAGEDVPELPDEAAGRLVLALNKCDLADPTERLAALETRFPNCPVVAISAHSGEGIETLAQAIARTATGRSAADGALPLVTRARHEDALRRSVESLQAARLCIAESRPAELIAVDVHGALAALGEITGETAREEIIAGIFAAFCLGK